jgi:hypothetical protein
MEPEVPLPHSQEPHNSPAVQLVERNPQLPTLMLISDVKFHVSVTEKAARYPQGLSTGINAGI